MFKDGVGTAERVSTSEADSCQDSKATTEGLPIVVSLFAGAGGLDLGFKQAGYKVAVAVDSSTAAIRTHKKNFPRTLSKAADLNALGAQGLVELVMTKVPMGSDIAVIGGPPCQGFSRANNSSGPSDPRNGLAALYIRIVRELQHRYNVRFLVFENVLGIRDKKNKAAYQAILQGIESCGFEISEKTLCALDFGVPQNRKRVILAGLMAPASELKLRRRNNGPKTVRDVLQGLPRPTFFQRGLQPADIPYHPNHWTMAPKSHRFSNPSETIPESRSFKRLQWDFASPTVAYGNREIHIHPNGKRRLSVYEAMLLQGFPSNFVLEGNLSEQVTQVSNAVPPPLGRSIAQAISRAMEFKP
ncbi:DNA cytosine methyltransferase [Luteimonas sp. RIT-PG2_3]